MEEIIKKIYKRDKISLRKLQLKYVIKYISQYKHFPLLRDFIESHKNTYCFFSYFEYLTCPRYCTQDCLNCNHQKNNSTCHLIFYSTTLTQDEIDFMKSLLNAKKEMRMYSETFFYEIIFKKEYIGTKETEESLSFIHTYYNYIGFNQDLHKEGVQMHNCIGTYFDKVINGECGLYYGTVNNKRYNAELIYDKERKKLQIRQLFGKFNEPPEECEVKDFKQAVKTFTVKP